METPTDVTTAVIAAAGSATRMWPASKSVPKELFPLGRVPAIVHIVWEFLEVGIRRIVIVVTEEASAPMRRLFDASISAPKKVLGDVLVQRFLSIFESTEFVFINQTGNYGNGTPLRLASEEVGQAPCIYAFGDDVVLGENVSKGLLYNFRATGCPVLAAQSVEPSRKCQFGMMGIHFTPVTATACGFAWQDTTICCGHLSQVDTHLRHY